MMQKLMNKMNKKGFTLIELIVVIAIIAILAAVLIPRFSGFTAKAKSTQILVEAKQVATAIDSLLAEGSATGSASVQALAFGGTAPKGALSGTVDASGAFTWSMSGFKAGRVAGGGVAIIP